MYAIIEDSGSQIKVTEGDVIKVAIRDLPPDAATLTFDRVLMVGGREGGEATIGAPLVEGAKVVADILVQDRTEKLVVRKYRRRKHYSRKKGHRQDYLQVKVTQIDA